MAHGAPTPGKRVGGPLAGARVPLPEGTRVVKLLKTTTLHEFKYDVFPLPEDGRMLMIFQENGEAISLPFDREAQRDFIKKFTAPSVPVADMRDLKDAQEENSQG